jgi:hypothetical protein
VIEAGPAGNDVPADDAVETAGTDPSTTSAGTVTIAMAGTAQSAGVSPPPATSTVVEIPRGLKNKGSCYEEIFVVSVDLACIMHILFLSTCIVI